MGRKTAALLIIAAAAALGTAGYQLYDHVSTAETQKLLETKQIERNFFMKTEQKKLEFYGGQWLSFLPFIVFLALIILTTFVWGLSPMGHKRSSTQI